jgi:hypothetical protein
MHREIPIGQGRVTLVDQIDFEQLGHHEWFLSKTGYVVGRVPHNRTYALIYLHRLILDAPAGQQVDHINGDPLDNRRKNLRLATPQQNGQNRRVSLLSETRLKGVGWHKDRRKYHARIQLQGIRVHLGFFTDVEVAAMMYDAAARALFGPYALCNYPDRPTPRFHALLVAQRLQRRGLVVDQSLFESPDRDEQ